MDGNVICICIATTVCVIFACATAYNVAERRRSSLDAIVGLIALMVGSALEPGGEEMRQDGEAGDE